MRKARQGNTINATEGFLTLFMGNTSVMWTKGTNMALCSKIGILYICTGKYTVFWNGFHESAEKLFLCEHEKHYFVFTDAKPTDIDYPTGANVKVFQQDKLGWPYDTLMRFKMFLKAEKEIVQCDYVFFFNANMQFVDHVGEEILPNTQDEGLLAVKHPGYHLDSKWVYPYETNKKSQAYAPKRLGQYYFMGGLNGGVAANYLTMIRELDRDIDLDTKNGIIARWHDESHLNRYLLGRKIRVLGPEYGVPEGLSMNGLKAKIIIRDKTKWGGHQALRNIQGAQETPGGFDKIRRIIVFLFRKIYRGLKIKNG
jgi:hypothetical protein